MYNIRSWLCVGKYRETLDENYLIASNIGAVLQLAEAITYTNLQTLYLPVDDTSPISERYIRQGVTFVLQAKAFGIASPSCHLEVIMHVLPGRYSVFRGASGASLQEVIKKEKGKVLNKVPGKNNHPFGPKVA